MTAQAEMTPSSLQDERQLAEDIARAMTRRPLMSRLASIEDARAEVAQTLSAIEATITKANDEPELAAPPPLSARSEPPPLPEMADSEAQSDAVFDETLPPTTPPSSVEWLRKARRERRKERMRHAAGWLATIAIGVTIIGTTAVMLQQ